METAAEALRLAIKMAGGPTKLAEALGITQGAVSQWKRCPAERCADVEKLTGISREALRPDVFR
ncbi:MAG: hypothetical protein GTO63_31610 [Anaerolineae bacterium]|nr:hypothetical protein [Anaerolineae bacterium]NIN99235.1 hypothetical protein [Anaerolineae bacterium]NIQ82074.1 hypothetical protein [Anaerolineae bacterium]